MNTINNHFKTKLSVNERFFEKIDTEEKAYWLGYIMADGCVTKSSPSYKNANRVYLNCKSGDMDHLQLFKEHIEFSGEIRTSAKYHKTKDFTYTTSEIKISRRVMCDDLLMHGVIERKTGHEIIPDTIPSDFKRHFIRGFFDGDGSITIKKCFRIGSCSETIINQINDFIYDEIGSRMPVYVSNSYSKTFFTIDSGSRLKNKMILDVLYENSNVYLKRKHERYIQYFCSPV